MKNQILSTLFILVLIICSSCEGGETVTLKNPVNRDYLVGKWKFQDWIYTFNNDSTFSCRTEDGLSTGKWNLEANILFLEGQLSGSYNIVKIWDDSFRAEDLISKFEKFE